MLSFWGNPYCRRQISIYILVWLKALKPHLMALILHMGFILRLFWVPYLMCCLTTTSIQYYFCYWWLLFALLSHISFVYWTIFAKFWLFYKFYPKFCPFSPIFATWKLISLLHFATFQNLNSDALWLSRAE